MPDLEVAVETSWLEDFLVLAECGNFSRAAQRRHVAQSAMSRRIKSLEEWVGTALFNRDTHRLGLTDAGNRFLPAAQTMLRQLNLAREDAREAADQAHRGLRFASTHALSMTFFPDWLCGLEEGAGGGAGPAAVTLTADNMEGCERLMLEGRAQFLLCHHHPLCPIRLDPGGFRSVRLGADRLVPISAPDAAGAPLHLLPGSDAEPVDAACYGASSGLGRILSTVQAQHGPPRWLHPVFTSHVATVLRTMAHEGRGLAFLPLSLVEVALRDGVLVRAGDARWDIPIEIRLFRPRARQNAAAEALWSQIRAGLPPVPDGEDG